MVYFIMILHRPYQVLFHPIHRSDDVSSRWGGTGQHHPIKGLNFSVVILLCGQPMSAVGSERSGWILERPSFRDGSTQIYQFPISKSGKWQQPAAFKGQILCWTALAWGPQAINAGWGEIFCHEIKQKLSENGEKWRENMWTLNIWTLPSREEPDQYRTRWTKSMMSN